MNGGVCGLIRQYTGHLTSRRCGLPLALTRHLRKGRAKALHGCRQFVSRDVALSCLTNATHEVRGDGYGGSYLAAGRLT